MSPVRTVMRRTSGAIRTLYSSALASGLFLAVSGALFVFRLTAAEGSQALLPVIWTMAAAPVAPFLAALLGMEVWSDDLRSGRVEMLLAAPVRERDLVVGKFLGVYRAYALNVVAFLLAALAATAAFAPQLSSATRLLDFLPGLAALLLQGALWCAVAVTASVFSRHSPAAAGLAIVATAAVPRGVWAALSMWSGPGRSAFGEMILDEHAADLASGSVVASVVFGYLAVSVLLLFVSSKRLAAMRYRGARSRGWRVLNRLVVAAAAVLTVLSVALVSRVPAHFEFAVGGSSLEFSEQMRDVLSEAKGRIRVTCLVPRSDPAFRGTAQFLRALRRESVSLGGVELELQFVDPRWDVADADRLIRMGAPASGVVFERGRRMSWVQLGDGLSERSVAAAVRQLTLPAQRRCICWTTGHGERSYLDYGSRGMSDIARDLVRDGYSNATVDLAGEEAIPADCALVVVAGARNDFSREELRRLDSHLRDGGRLLVLTDTVESGGVLSLLPEWGVRAAPVSAVGTPTLTGTDVIASGFSDHAIVAGLKGERVVLDRPVGFVPTAAVDNATGADRIEFTPLVSVAAGHLAAVVEKGAGVGSDLSLRPTRIVLVGDSGIALNGQLAVRANANRDFILNCVAYLSGIETSAASSGAGVLRTGIDREGKLRLLASLALVLPLVLMLLQMLLVAARRRRG